MHLATLKLDRFLTYVQQSGADMLEPTNPYEKIRFRCKEGIGIVYQGKKGFTLEGAARTAYVYFERKLTWKAGEVCPPFKRPEMRELLLARDGCNCFYCGLPLGEDITVEHILSKEHGGSDHLANLALAHEKCNVAAGCLPVVEKFAIKLMRSTKNNS